MKAYTRPCINLLIFMLVGLLITACGKDEKKENAVIHLNLTQKELWDDPIYNEMQEDRFNAYINEKISKDKLYDELEAKNGNYQASYDELMHLIEQFGKKKPLQYNVVQADLYEQAFIITDNINEKKKIYHKILETANQKAPMPQVHFLYIWNSVLGMFAIPQHNKFFYSELSRMMEYFQDNQMALGQFYANRLLGLSLKNNGDYAEAFQRFLTADSIINAYKSEMYGRNWQQKERNSLSVISHADNQRDMFQCKIYLRDTLWATKHLHELDDNIQYVSDLPPICYNLKTKAYFYAWVGKDKEYEEAMKRLHATLDSLPQDYPGYEEAMGCIYVPYALHEIKHHHPEKALPYALKYYGEAEMDEVVAKCYEELGRHRDAMAEYKRMNNDKRERLNGRRYAQLRNMSERMNLENKEMELIRNRAHHRQVILLVSSLVVLLILLIVVILYFLSRQRIFNMHLSQALKKVKEADHTKAILNKHLTEALEETQKADRAKSSFLRSMTHEIRTPLNSITGFAQMLRPATNEEKMMVDEIRTNSTNLKNLVDTIISLSEYESETKPLPTAPTSLLMLCNIAIDRCTENIKQGVTIGMVSPEPNDIVLPLNADAMGKMLTKLINNAVKFTNEGSITVGYRMERDTLTIEVTDTGIGIPETERERIFDRFVKLDKFAPGFGLGLSLVKAIANRLGGNVAIDPTYSSGTRVRITLPVTEN